MNIPGIRLIVPLLCGLLFFAVPSSNAKEPEKAKPSPTPKANARLADPQLGEGLAVTKTSRSNADNRTANPKASPTPKPNAVLADVDKLARRAPKPSPTPKAK